MRETFKLEWILIGCQCGVLSLDSSWKKNNSESDPNDIVPYVFIVIVVV